MGNKRISALDDITSVGGTSTAEVNANDILPITDVDDTTGSPQGTTKGVKVSDLMGASPVQSVNTATGAVVLDADDVDDSSTTKKFVTASDITKLGNLSGTNTGDQDLSSYQLQPTEGAFVDGDKTKLVGIEASADVTDTTNVEAAGALMDSEVINLAQVKAFDSADYATAAQGTLADTAIQPAALGTAAALNTGTADGDVVVLGATGLPAVDGSQLTGISGGGSVTAIGPFGYAHINTTAAGAGTGMSWAAFNVSSSTTTVTFHAAQLNTDYHVAAHYADNNYYGDVLINYKTTNGFEVTFFDSTNAVTNPSNRAVVLMAYASDPTLRTIVAAPGGGGGSGGGGSGGGAFTGVEWSNMTSNQYLYFDDYQQNVYNISTASWGSSNYMYFDVSTLAGKWKKYTIGDYYDSVNGTWTGAMWTDLNAALGTTGLGTSQYSSANVWGNGTLGALNGNQIENSTNTPIYVWASTAGTTVTKVQATDGMNASQWFVPIIYGMDWDDMQGWQSALSLYPNPGPKWGMTLVMDVNGYLEETKDASGYPYHSPIQPYAAYLYSTTISNTFTGFSLTGNTGGSVGTVTGGDQT